MSRSAFFTLVKNFIIFFNSFLNIISIKYSYFMSANIDWVEAKVCKINPPIDGDVQNVSVVIKKER